MWCVGFRVGVEQTGANVGQPWIDGATDGTGEGGSVSVGDGVGMAVG